MTMELTYEGTSRFVDTERGKIHYHLAGDGPPLVLLHGSGPGVSGWANFRGNLGAFAEHFTTYVVDLPGFGASEVPTSGHPVVDAPAALVAFLDAVGRDRVSIVGNSMGGGVGATFGIEHPDRLQRLVTLGGVGVNLLSPSPPEGIKLLVEFMEQPTRAALIAWLHSMVYDPSFITDDLIELRLQTATEPGNLEYGRRMYSRAGLEFMAKMARNPPAPPQWTLLHRLVAPTLITWGRDDRVTPLDWALVPMRTIPKCELHVFYDCGHWAMIERQAEFESTVLSFLLRDVG
jgi:pimeloyl-ACP methyl ester carboxylesterase